MNVTPKTVRKCAWSQGISFDAEYQKLLILRDENNIKEFEKIRDEDMENAKK